MRLCAVVFLLVKLCWIFESVKCQSTNSPGIRSALPTNALERIDETTDAARPTKHVHLEKNTNEKLKTHLFVERGYDKNIRPVLDHTKEVRVMVDFTPRQILDLVEKNQVLRTFVHFRLMWNDAYIRWDPEEFDNVTSFYLASDSLWRPDIVLYEDTSNMDYNPRMLFTEVFYNGDVRYLEPIVFETSCSVNIAHFPFDSQICTLTFTPWAFPTSKVDVSSKRNKEEMARDLKDYLIKTGEWQLEDLTIVKRSQSFAGILSVNESDAIPEEKYVLLDSQSYLSDVMTNRSSDVHWSEVIFLLHLRRNSALYMQSMLFPAILLTTIAVLGFYLPPDSGERIGLQITILLTFMVFLLTVGEMFPASSTGPYLGLYYVICMGLLGINLLMTVLVLHMHYMPAAALIENKPTENGEISIRKPPTWIRVILMLAKCSLRSRCMDRKKYPRCNLTRSIRDNRGRDVSSSEEECESPSTESEETPENNNEKNNRSEEFSKEIKGALQTVHDIGQFLKFENKGILERVVIEDIEGEWKAMARVVDDICLKVYVALLIICHVAILIAAVLDKRKVLDPLIAGIL